MRPIMIDGKLHIPKRIELDDMIGDVYEPIDESHPDYDEWVKWLDKEEK